MKSGKPEPKAEPKSGARIVKPEAGKPKPAPSKPSAAPVNKKVKFYFLTEREGDDIHRYGLRRKEKNEKRALAIKIYPSFHTQYSKN